MGDGSGRAGAEATNRDEPMPRTIFVNLPVKDLDASIRFYEAIGCEKNEQFTNEQGAMMVWSESIRIMLLTREFFATFTDKAIADAGGTAQVLLALSRDSREDVDAITEAAARAGGTADPRAPQDTGFMYGRVFEDLDGHTFEPVWMDPSAIEDCNDDASRIEVA
jgi:predicted lactoylglutathione lyase